MFFFFVLEGGEVIFGTYQCLTRGLSAAHSKNSEEIIDLHKIKACDASKTCGVASMFIFLKTTTFKIWLFFFKNSRILKIK